MNSTVRNSFLLLLLLVGSAANAADFSGVTARGEAALSYPIYTPGNDTLKYTGDGADQTYRLSQAQILLSKETEQMAFMSRLAFSPTEYSTATDPNSRSHFGNLEQLEVYFKPSSTLYIGFGRFLTTMGFESSTRMDNLMYLTTIAFSAIVPSFGDGLRAKYVQGDTTVALTTYNRAPYNSFGDDRKTTKTTELSVAQNLGRASVYAGYLMGADNDATGAVKEEKTASSVYATYKLADNWTTALEYESKTSKFGEEDRSHWADSSSFWMVYGIDKHNLGIRYEQVRGANEIGYGIADTVNSITVSDKIVMSENLNLYIEYRQDTANEEIFPDEDGVANSKDSAGVLAITALAHF